MALTRETLPQSSLEVSRNIQNIPKLVTLKKVPKMTSKPVMNSRTASRQHPIEFR